MNQKFYNNSATFFTYMRVGAETLSTPPALLESAEYRQPGFRRGAYTADRLSMVACLV